MTYLATLNSQIFFYLDFLNDFLQTSFESKVCNNSKDKNKRNDHFLIAPTENKSVDVLMYF